MLVTVSGPPGSGKSTAAPALADAFDLEHISGGDIFRELADERGYTPLEFNKLAEEDEQIDRDLDARLQDIARERDDVVLESRLAGWLAGDHADFRFWLDAPVAVRGARIADREGKDPDAAAEETAAREGSEAKRYMEYYGIDIDDRSIYDLSMNTGRWSEDAMVDVLVGAVEAYAPSADEGKEPVTLDVEF
ncbi:AAA family ATPase [Halorubellus sp. JP-L1]|uniref:(d)CMP kinase n=1 Tax=Halorubellus sp. JP-L1 TaxID=2715753 RepID=UPI00140BA288|nr:AAA family ATPase [Halorubellus sp. JP-L1]NHN41230.1 AAA family ATPase [Halorubellus sp. JP-L1]